jgi:hypothetical protein
MSKRIQKLVIAVAALTALALGGAVFAQAQTTSPLAKPEPVSKPDKDKVQSGDQTTPDNVKHSGRVAATDPAGGGNGQSGDQSTPDTGSGSETPGVESPETGAGSESGPSDGAGGYADPPGNATADHQFQGNE